MHKKVSSLIKNTTFSHLCAEQSFRIRHPPPPFNTYNFSKISYGYSICHFLIKDEQILIVRQTEDHPCFIRQLTAHLVNLPSTFYC